MSLRQELVESLGAVLTSRLDLDKALSFQDEIGKQILDQSSGAYDFRGDDIPTIPIICKEEDHFLEVGGMLSGVILRWEWQADSLAVTIEAENAFAYFERNTNDRSDSSGNDDFYLPGHSLSVSLFLKNVLLDFQTTEKCAMQVLLSEMEIALTKPEGVLWEQQQQPHVLKSVDKKGASSVIQDDYNMQFQVSIHKIVVPALLEMNKFIAEGIVVDRGTVHRLQIPTCNVFVVKAKESRAKFESFLNDFSICWVDAFQTPHVKVETLKLFFVEAETQSNKKPLLRRPWKVKAFQGDDSTHVGTILRHYVEVFVERTLKKEANEEARHDFKTKIGDKVGGVVVREIASVGISTPPGLILSMGVVHAREAAKVVRRKVAKKRAERRGEVWEEPPDETEEEKKIRQDKLKVRTVSAAGTSVGAGVGMTVGLIAGPPGMIIGALVGGILAEKVEQKRQKVRDAWVEKRGQASPGEEDDITLEEPQVPNKKWRPFQKLRANKKEKDTS